MPGLDARLRFPDEGQAGRDRVQAADFATVAEQAVGLHLNVPQLAREARRPVEHLAVEQNAQPHAPVDVDRQHVLFPFGQPEAVFADGGGVGVVDKHHGQLKLLLQPCCQRKVGTRQVRVGLVGTLSDVDQARHGHADAPETVPVEAVGTEEGRRLFG